MSFIRDRFSSFSAASRHRRAEIFRRSFTIGPETKILDLGSEDGRAIAALLEPTAVRPGNVWLADIEPDVVSSGASRFGFNAVKLKEFEALPFEDGFFDIVFCSSVIEHVTVPKSEVWSIWRQSEFSHRAAESQKFFAAEIARVGRGFFVQTPNRNFPIESHTWLPFFGLLPRPLLILSMRITNRLWIKASIPDFNLLSKAEMQKLFPDARIELEKRFGMTKSLMAIRPNY